ncbi:uncharacterized protein LOC127853146 isoform X2 [Dreissena polymorpha]|uniref:uncharacterized protein LOC127853146 isoform X2 n=1 Tax=Dreissena polymorpha TaxID=45954 RepID=UPI00226542B2|nr:uncharacterized protein LOC127853146 isoform X2 [Dreissena polymorpha]
MGTKSTISASKVSDYENIVRSNIVDVELIGNRCEAVNSVNAETPNDLSEDQLHRLLGKLQESELQDIAALVNKDSVSYPLENPCLVAFTLAEEKRILYLQVLLIIVGRLDTALLMTDFAQKHCLVHLHQVANCVFTIVVFDDISDVEKHELLTVVRSWMPEAKIVLTKWGCEKCSTIDHHLPGILYTVREALNEFNTIKRNIKKTKEAQISHRVLPYSDAHAKGKRTINDFRSGVQKIVSPINCGPKCLT